MKAAVIGTGYVGLATIASLGELGHRIIGVDMDDVKIKQLANGKLPIYEPDMEPAIQTLLNQGALHFTTSIQQAVEEARVLFITVGTPPLSDGRPNMNYVEDVAVEIGRHMKKPRIVVNKSTVPVGSADRVKILITNEIKRRGKSIAFDVVSNPEFLQEGKALLSARKPERIVLGCSSPEAAKIMLELYKKIESPKLITSPRDAEMIKYASNGFLATKISFINEIARLCDHLAVDVTEVARGIGADERIGAQFLQAGIGYGGSCFPKDTSALVMMGREFNLEMPLLRNVQEVNRTQTEWFMEKIKHELGTLDRKRIALLGLAFKPETDDIREAPSLKLHRLLVEAGAIVNGFDPAARDQIKKLSLRMNLTDDAYQAVENADAVIICTEWKEFMALDWRKVKKLMKGDSVFDGRNVLDRKTMKLEGFRYYGVGRK